MIVADTNLIAYFTIPGDRTPLANQIFREDSVWAAPRLWRSEFQNVILIYLNQGLYTLNEGLEFMRSAENLVQYGDYRIGIGSGDSPRPSFEMLGVRLRVCRFGPRIGRASRYRRSKNLDDFSRYRGFT